MIAEVRFHHLMNPQHCLWRFPPEQLRLRHGEIHVWRADLNEQSAYVRSILPFLTSTDLRRVESFHFQKNREHFILGRGILRLLLENYLDIEPDQLRICYGQFGKPALAESSNTRRLHFNVSHSHELALFAFARDVQLGVDVEYVRPDFAFKDVARQFFSPAEFEKLLRLQPDQMIEAFFNCWTRKEAYIKAVGKGLSIPLDQFEVSFAPSEPAALLSVKDSTTDVPWSLQELSPGPGYVAAIVTEKGEWRLSCWHWGGASKLIKRHRSN